MVGNSAVAVVDPGGSRFDGKSSRMQMLDSKRAVFSQELPLNAGRS